MIRGRAFLVLALSPALMATSCPIGVSVDVEPNPAAVEQPGFALESHEESPPAGFEVRECSSAGQVMWRLERGESPDSARSLRITCGRVPPGFHENAPARALVPGGCYHARAWPAGSSGSGDTEDFRVLPTGRILLGYPGLKFGPSAQLNRASVLCVRGYRRARTPADTAAMDGRERPVDDARLSCGWIREHWPDALLQTRTREEEYLQTASTLVLLIAIFALEDRVD